MADKAGGCQTRAVTLRRTGDDRHACRVCDIFNPIVSLMPIASQHRYRLSSAERDNHELAGFTCRNVRLLMNLVGVRGPTGIVYIAFEQERKENDDRREMVQLAKIIVNDIYFVV